MLLNTHLNFYGHITDRTLTRYSVHDPRKLNVPIPVRKNVHNDLSES